MPTLTITKTYLNGNILTQTDLDNAFNSVSTLLNTTLLDSTNIQTGGLLGTNLANSTITSSQLAAGSVGSAQISSSAVGAAQIGPLAVQTANIALGAVTQATRATLNNVTSGATGTFSTASASAVDITNLTVSITTTGRPVYIGAQPNATGAGGALYATAGSNPNASIYILRGATNISTYNALTGTIPNYSIVDTPSSGTYTYKMQASANAGTTFNAINMVLIAYEL